MAKTKAEQTEIMEQAANPQDTGITPKVRFIGNPTNQLIIIPDLRNAVDENGLSLNPGEKIDLTQYYTPQEINRSRGLDRLLKGSKNPVTGEEIIPVSLLELKSLDDELPDPPKPFAYGKEPGSVFHADRNYADQNLDRLATQEQKETERAMAQSGGIKAPVSAR